MKPSMHTIKTKQSFSPDTGQLRSSGKFPPRADAQVAGAAADRLQRIAQHSQLRSGGNFHEGDGSPAFNPGGGFGWPLARTEQHGARDDMPDSPGPSEALRSQGNFAKGPELRTPREPHRFDRPPSKTPSGFGHGPAQRVGHHRLSGHPHAHRLGSGRKR